MNKANFCWKCGASIATSYNSCSSCGAKLKTHSSQQHASKVESTTPTKTSTPEETSTALNYLSQILSPEARDSEKWETDRRGYLSALAVLRPLYEGIADAQIGNAPDMFIYSESLTGAALPNQLPKIYAHFDNEEARKELRGYFLEVLELGCLMNINEFIFPAPNEFDSSEDKKELSELDLSHLEKIFLGKAEYIFRLQSQLRGLNRYLEDDTNQFWEGYSFERVAPFFKSYGVKSGFLNSTIGKAILHSRAIFCIGVTLGAMYGDALTGKLWRDFNIDMLEQLRNRP